MFIMHYVTFIKYFKIMVVHATSLPADQLFIRNSAMYVPAIWLMNLNVKCIKTLHFMEYYTTLPFFSTYLKV